jgi:hypothetical protein
MEPRSSNAFSPKRSRGAALVRDNAPRKHEHAGPSDHQGDIAKAVDAHLGKVARELDF